MNTADVVARPIARVARLPLLAPLAGRDFRLVWFGEGVSLLGDQFNIIALSWLVLGMTGSGFALGATVIAALVLGAQVQLWQLALVGALFGTVDAIFLPAINTLVPRLVPVDRLGA